MWGRSACDGALAFAGGSVDSTGRSGTAPSDQELVDRCLQADEQAWRLLADLLRRLIGGLAATRWLDGGLQEEIAQEVEVELLRDGCRVLRQFAGRSRLSTYLGTIILRVALRLRRADGSIPWGELESMDHSVEVADALLGRIETWVAVQQILSPIEALILRLYAAGYTGEEAADMLSRLTQRPWTAAMVYKHKARAMVRLQRALAD